MFSYPQIEDALEICLFHVYDALSQTGEAGRTIRHLAGDQQGGLRSGSRTTDRGSARKIPIKKKTRNDCKSNQLEVSVTVECVLMCTTNELTLCVVCFELLILHT